MIQVHPTPAESGLVDDPDAVHGQSLTRGGRAKCRRRQQLPQRLGRPVEPSAGGGGQLDAVGRDLDDVRLVSQVLVLDQPKVAVCGRRQLAAGAGAFTVFLLIALAYPAGMGMGDVKLAGVMGLYLGVDVLPAMLVAFLSGSVVGVAVIAQGGMDKRKTGLPFAPFLALGGLVALLAGPQMIDLYRDHFL